MNDHDVTRAAVDAHFAGAIAPAKEAGMREHLRGCTACATYYRRHLLLTRLDPAALAAEERLGRALGLGRPTLRRPAAVLSLAVLGAAAAGASFAWVRGRTAMHETAFASRGARDSGATWLEVHCMSPGQPPATGPTTIHPGDELAFTYGNQARRLRLLVFGVDEHRHVFWYHPAWVAAEPVPTAVSIQSGPEAHELGEAIAHRLDGRDLAIHGVFTDEAVSVRDVEAMIEALPHPGAALPVPDAVQQTVTLKVVP